MPSVLFYYGDQPIYEEEYEYEYEYEYPEEEKFYLDSYYCTYFPPEDIIDGVIIFGDDLPYADRYLGDF